ncbi:uncharacterized protein PHALS_06294 [Plasmopara halstedii]|uniref:Uncharacterized protein n=1 Tax=Plasmopara halstedii TaxID=4781 RepID=A0A0P1B4E0_PLAHL|nr:uncharacterized protein PHALS_06294 [Plasmopara halstedii]CEG48474.1 hypothetical protein PHALS_06294 [Plasmopara halstedii]|eukprot:XP_024584843.1 hypothetical protein PHALS_06294 [Plasmopara halstedii]
MLWHLWKSKITTIVKLNIEDLQMSYPRSSTALLNRCTAAELPVILMKFRPKDRGT